MHFNGVTLHDPANQLDQPRQARRTPELSGYLHKVIFLSGLLTHSPSSR